jgi:O-antigen ligase
MDREQLDHWCERAILGLVLAILVYSPLAFGCVPHHVPGLLGAVLQGFPVVQWLAVAALAVWLARFWINPQHRLLWPPVSWAVLAFMGYAVARYLTADIEYVARQELVRVLVYGFLFFLIVNNLHRQETTQIIGLTVVFLGMAMALYAIFQFLNNSEHVWQTAKHLTYRKRGSGPFMNPNHLAGYLEMVLPLALAYTLTGRFRPLAKVFLGYASLMIFVGLMATVSRGGWIAAAISLSVFFTWLVRQRDFRVQALILGGALVAVCAVFFLKVQLAPKRGEAMTLNSSADDVRFLLWRPAWAMWCDHPWFGVGPAHFGPRFPQYRPVVNQPGTDLYLQHDPGYAHNDYLNLLVDWGLLGAVIVLAAWALFYSDVFRSWKYVQRSQNDLIAKRSNRASVVMGGSLGLLAILVHSFVDFNMHIPANAILAVTLMALVSGHFRFATERNWHTVRLPVRIPANLVLIAGLIFLGRSAWTATVERHWLTVAEAASAGDIKDLASFAEKLRHPGGGVSAFVIGRLSAGTKQALAQHQSPGSDPIPLQRMLLEDLDSIIHGSSIYDAQRFSGIALRPETQQLLAQQPQGEGLVRLNRLLLEDAYPQEILREPTVKQLSALQRALAADSRNPETACRIGEIIREQSWMGQPGYKDLAEEAIKWYQRAFALDPFDPVPQVRVGMCLDWLGQHAEAERAFKRALALDPNGYFTLAHMGWHYFQVQDYASAEEWLNRSLHLYSKNPVALSYLKIVRDRKQEKPTPR